MRDPTHTSHVQDAKHITRASPSPAPYPVSIRTYKKKDYEYLSTFPRMVHSHSVLRAAQSDAKLPQERSDCESDLTTSSVGYTTSISSASSISSVHSYAKDLIASMDSEGHYQHQHYHQHQHQHQQQQQQQQHQHQFLSTETFTHSPQMSMECADSNVETKGDKLDDRSSADVNDDIAGDFPGPTEKAVKVPVRSKSKPKPRPHNTPAVLPKFGSWDTRNPSSGEAYTLIFRRLKDEKESGGLTVCTSPTHSKDEEAVESLSQESKAKETLHSNPEVQKDTSRRKAKGASHQEAAYNRKPATMWNLCCKASVLDD